VSGETKKVGKRNGIGRFTSPDESIYEGTWAEGKGTCLNSDGSTFHGNWVNGKRQGFGMYFENGGAVQEGIWNQEKYTDLA
jgi:hypothetical protein